MAGLIAGDCEDDDEEDEDDEDDTPLLALFCLNMNCSGENTCPANVPPSVFCPVMLETEIKYLYF